MDTGIAQLYSVVDEVSGSTMTWPCMAYFFT